MSSIEEFRRAFQARAVVEQAFRAGAQLECAAQAKIWHPVKVGAFASCPGCDPALKRVGGLQVHCLNAPVGAQGPERPSCAIEAFVCNRIKREAPARIVFHLTVEGARAERMRCIWRGCVPPQQRFGIAPNAGRVM